MEHKEEKTDQKSICETLVLGKTEQKEDQF